MVNQLLSISRFLICAIFATITFTSLQAQLSISNQTTFGGKHFEEVAAATNCKSGGSWIAGNTQSADFPGRTETDGGCWVAKLDEQGIVQSQIFPGGNGKSVVHGMCETADGGFAIAGTALFEDVENNRSAKDFGKSEFWVAKFDQSGNLKWQQTLGSEDDDVAFSIQSTPDGGLVAVGEVFTKSFGKKSLDLMLVKFSDFGRIEWQRPLGGSRGETGGRGLAVDNLGNIYVAGNTQSNDKSIGDDNHRGGIDGYVAKISPAGKVVWQHLLGGYGDDLLTDLQISKDGKLHIFGTTNSSDGDLSENRGGTDLCLFQMNFSGKMLWAKTFGGSKDEIAGKMVLAENGQIYLFSTTISTDGQVSGLHGNLGNSDGWMVCASKNGQFQWQKTYGGERPDAFQLALPGEQNSLTVFGTNQSFEMSGLKNAGGSDIWMIKMMDTEPVTLSRNMINKIDIYPNPAIDRLNFTINCGTAECPVEAISFTDLTGKVVFYQENPASPVFFGHLPEGIYFVQFKIEGKYEPAVRVTVGG